jgi:hypothetical protein
MCNDLRYSTEISLSTVLHLVLEEIQRYEHWPLKSVDR